MDWDPAGQKKKGLAILFTALVIASVFVVFFDVGSASDLSVSAPDSTPEKSSQDTITVTFTIAKDERVPIEHVALKVQDRTGADLNIPIDIRWKPACTDDDNTGIETLPGYGDSSVVDAASATCEVQIDGDTTADDGSAYTTADVFGRGYLQVKGTGYGYGNTFLDELGQLQGGYGYDCRELNHRCTTSLGPGYGEDDFALDDTFTFADVADDIDKDGVSREGYGEGYGYNFDAGEGGNAREVKLIWKVPVTWPSSLTTDRTYDIVAVIWTGSSSLREIASPASGNTITVAAAASTGGGGGGGAQEEEETATEKTLTSPCVSCTVNFGEVTSGTTLTINFDGDDPLFNRLRFTVNADFTNLNVRITRHDPDDLPTDADDPGDIVDPRYYFTLEVEDGTTDESDQVSDFELRWKLETDWMNGLLAGFPIQAPSYGDDAIALGHFLNGQWVSETTSPLPGEDTATTKAFESTFDTLSTFSAGAFDDQGPAFSNERPTDRTDERRPEIGVDYTDAVGVDTDSVTITFDGNDVTSQATVTDSGVTFMPTSDLAFATYDVSVTAADHFGNSGSESWSFQLVECLDDLAPTISNFQPAPDASVGTDATISAAFSDDECGVDLDTVTITVDGEDVTSQADVTSSGFTYTPADGLATGDHTVSVSLSDLSGNDASESWSFTVEDGLDDLMVIIAIIVVVIVIAAVAAWYMLVYKKQ